MGLAVMTCYAFADGTVLTLPLVTLDDQLPCHTEWTDLEGHRRILGLRAFGPERAWYQEGWCGPVQVYA